MEIYKFGGTSVNSAEAVKNVANIINDREVNKTIVVVSAMGKTTNAMENILNTFYKGDTETKDALIKELLGFHLNIIQVLFEDTEHRIYSLFKNLMLSLSSDLKDIDQIEYDKAYDKIVSYGERISTLIISQYLNHIGINNKEVDVRDIIKTNSLHKEASVNWQLTNSFILEKIPSLMQEVDLIITQGFIASDANNSTTSLGREGSDYSAAIIAFCTNASKITIWKDVPGVLNADPKYFKNTRKLECISYNDATELAYFGASIIHPKTIKPLQNKNIPLHIRSFINPKESGTWVGLENVDYTTNIPSFIVKHKQLLISIYPNDFSFINEHNLQFIFESFVKYGIKVNMMQNSALSFSICIDENTINLNNFKRCIGDKFDIVFNENLELITIRHYTNSAIEKIVNNRNVLLEQRTRTTAQIVVKNI